MQRKHKQTGEKEGSQHKPINSKPLRGQICTYFTCAPFSLNLQALFRSLFLRVCVHMRMHACMHARTYVCGNLSIPEPTSTNAQQECKEKAAVQRPDSTSRWIANPSREKQADRKHEMDGEECKGNKVLFPDFSKQATLPSEKQKAQIRPGENRGGRIESKNLCPIKQSQEEGCNRCRATLSTREKASGLDTRHTM